MGKEVIAAVVTLGTGVVLASVAYQMVKPNSKGPVLVQQGTDLWNFTVGTIFKG